MSGLLDNYRALIARVDELCAGIAGALGARITCHEGCSGCCLAITIFPVEAAALRRALADLTPERSAEILNYVANRKNDVTCPLLADGSCLLYEARPIICRSHGFPILIAENDTQRLDCCPLNLKDGKALSGAHVIDLDRLNTVLVAINALYLKQTGIPEQPPRLSMAEALLTQGKD